MKTTFKVKVVFISDKLRNDGLVDDVNDQGKPLFHWARFKELIDKQDVELECILDWYTSTTEPTIIIRQK